MTDLVDIEFIKKNFPLWNKYFLDDDGEASETVLQNDIDRAAVDFLSYVFYTKDTIPECCKFDLLNIVKKYGLDRALGDVEFETKPMILKDYESTIARLQSYKDGTAVPEGTNLNSDKPSVIINAKPRRFGEWFNNDINSLPGGDNVNF
jgi:hypothetical protein